MMALAWGCAIAGLVLGGIASIIPGFPGCAVALLGLVAFAAITDFQVVTQGALLLAVGITAAGALGQLTGPVASSRALGGSAGAATGAAIGAALGALIPVPGVSWAAALGGALALGLLWSRGELMSWGRGVAGTAGGCLFGAAIDAIAVLGIGAVLGFADFWHELGRSPQL
jgi:uncharacterized protein YqgC (DUF456 family)